MTHEILGPGTLLGDRPAMAIGGARVAAAGTRPVENPATGEEFAEVPEAGADHVDQALRAARDAQRAWAGRSLPDRADVLAAVMREIAAHAEELARIVVAEQGKTITEARGEIAGTRLFFDVAHGRKYAPVGEMFPPNAPGEHLTIRDEPYGVVAAITAWNFPAALFGRKVAPAIMAGNAVVLKPSEVTPLSALALAEVCRRAGVPDGVVNVVTGSGTTVGRSLCEHPVTGMVTLTGSTRAGREILAQTAHRVIPVSLELGGKAPVIVFEDADLDVAVRQAVEARYWNCGQVCTCNERTFVHAARYEEFVRGFAEAAARIRVGDPLREESQMGPKVTGPEWRKVKDFVDGAVADGATVVLGGGRPEGPEFARGHWFAPTVIAEATNEMDIMRQEVFGPVAPIARFDGYDEVIEWANSTDYGLTSYVFTRNIDLAMRAMDDLRFGEVYVNKIGPEQPQGFHTGWKMSGLGGEDGAYGYARYLRKKTTYLRYR